MEDKPVFLPEEWRKYYMPVPLYFNDKITNEELFKKFNVDNPLSDKEGQEWIRENQVGHTSMSVGDMIYDGVDYFVCLNRGWAKVAWIGLDHAPNQ